MVTPLPDYVELESGLYFTQEQVDEENARDRCWRGLHKLTDEEKADYAEHFLEAQPRSVQRVFIQQLDSQGSPTGERVEIPLVNSARFMGTDDGL